MNPAQAPKFTSSAALSRSSTSPATIAIVPISTMLCVGVRDFGCKYPNTIRGNFPSRAIPNSNRDALAWLVIPLAQACPTTSKAIR